MSLYDKFDADYLKNAGADHSLLSTFKIKKQGDQRSDKVIISEITLPDFEEYIASINADSPSDILPVTQVANQYSLLDPGTINGQLAYVYNAQGTKWLPGTIGGSYYPAGFYAWDGSLWVSDRNAIVEQLALNTLSNTIKINSLADFPAPVNGVIELGGTPGQSLTYIIAPKAIDIGSNRFSITDGDVVIKGEHRTGSQITSTTTGNLFTSVDSNFFIEYVGFNCPSANFIDWSNPSGQVLSFATQNLILYSCINAGNIDGAFTTSLRTATIVSATGNGFSWSGLQSQINISQFLALDWVGVLFDFGTSQFDIINFSNGSRFLSPAGSTIFKGLPNNGNFKTDGRGIVEGNLFNGAGTAIDGFSTQDLQWSFSGNVFADNVTGNSVEATDCYLTASETVTISTPGVYVPVSGTNWTSNATSRFTVGTDGLITYLGLETIVVSVNASSTVAKVGGGANLICTKIAINGTPLDRSIGCTENTNPTQIMSSGFFQINTGDTIQLFTGNEDGTSDIIISTSTILINTVI